MGLRNPEPPKKEKLSTSGLGAGFLELFRPSLQSEKSASEQLVRAFYGWVYANVSAIAEEVSKIEPELYKVRFEKGEIKYDRILEHPVLDLLDKFNSINTASEAFYNVSAYLELVGDAFLLKNKPRMPTEIYLLDPTRVTVEPKPDGFGVKQYVYKRIVDGKSKDIIYRPELILPVKTPNPENPLRGKSTVAAAATAIDTSNLGQEFLKQFFQNGAIVNFVLSTDQRVTDDQIRRIQIQLKKEYGGVRNAFKALILGGGFKVEPVQHTNKEMEILAMLDGLRDYIMAMFKNTKTALGIVEDVNRANAEASIASWKQSVIRPKMMRIVDCLNEYLIPDYGDDLVLGFKDPVPENREAKTAEATALVNKVITVNEARTLLGYAVIPDKRFDELISERERQDQEKQRFEQGKERPKGLAFVNVERHLRRLGVYKRLEAHRQIYKSAHTLAEKMVKKRQKKRYHSFTDQQAETYWQKQMSQAELLEKNFQDKLEAYLKGIEDRAVGSLHASTKALINDDQEVQAGIDLFTPLLEEMAKLSGFTAYDLLKVSGVYTPSRKMAEVVRAFVEQMANSVVSTDKDKLEAILSEGLAAGDSIAHIEQRIRGEFADFRRSQSQRIARTEVLRASNAGALDAYQQSGVVSKAQWFTAEDDRVDEECAALDGKIVALGRNFFDTDYGSGTQPPLHPNCRCTLLPVVD